MEIFEKTLPLEALAKENIVKLNSSTRRIEVFCRVRPLIDKGKSIPYALINEDTVLELNENPEVLAKMGAVHCYRFTCVFGEKTDQILVFEKVCLPMLKDLFVSGYNGLVFTYGVTNAGKTYTMVGSDENPGLLRRTLEWIFVLRDDLQKQKCKEGDESPLHLKDFFALTHNESINENSFVDIKVTIQCFEVYNDDVFDLFAPKNKRNKLKLKEGEDKRTIIEDITTLKIENISGVKAALQKCLSARSVKDTLLNHSSSRSHCIFRITIQFCFENEKEELLFERSLNIVDLAGAERAKRTDNVGVRLKEANKINQSLSCLGRCLTALRDGTLPPYRETKLTKFLAEFFLEQSRIAMVTNISLEEQELEETVRVLNYSALARQVPPLVVRYENRQSVAFLSLKKPQERGNIPASLVPLPFLHSKELSETSTALAQLRSKFDCIEEKIDKIMRFLFASNEVPRNREEYPVSSTLPQKTTTLIKDEGTTTSPILIQGRQMSRAENIARNFRKKQTSEKKDVADNPRVSALFKRHSDYSAISTKDLALIISEKEQMEDKQLEEMLYR